jgi:hypothetical protein
MISFIISIRPRLRLGNALAQQQPREMGIAGHHMGNGGAIIFVAGTVAAASGERLSAIIPLAVGTSLPLGLGDCSLVRGRFSNHMKSPIQLIEQIIRAKTALHLRLAASRSGGKLEVGGRPIDALIAEVDAGIASYEQMLVLFKNEAAAAVMMEAAEIDDEEDE